MKDVGIQWKRFCGKKSGFSVGKNLFFFCLEVAGIRLMSRMLVGDANRKKDFYNCTAFRKNVYK